MALGDRMHERVIACRQTDLHARPVGVELLREQLRQTVVDALPHLRLRTRDDHLAGRADLEERGEARRCRRVARPARRGRCGRCG